MKVPVRYKFVGLLFTHYQAVSRYNAMNIAEQFRKKNLSSSDCNTENDGDMKMVAQNLRNRSGAVFLIIIPRLF
jgi:hypothetical protein